MEIKDSIRAYHIVLALLALAAYFSDDLRRIHAWLGYAVSAIIVFRLLWSFQGDPQLKLSCFIPCFKGIGIKNFLAHPATGKVLTLGVLLSLTGAAATGIALDKGRTLGLGQPASIQREAEGEPVRERQRERRHHERSAMREAHKIFADIFIVFVALHIAHMIAYRRPMAKWMFFLKR
ncbi:MAG: cytochrome b/b6 domain-containing protein [Alphaproteobacteria bacterium]|nr:cytochrome b/b6 domain-containing protein [Alphaproteobacteria bacterium]